MRILLLTLVALLLILPARADGEAFDLDAAAKAFASADDGAARLAAALTIAGAKAPAGDVAKALEEAWAWDDDVTKGAPVTWTRKGPDGKTRTVHAFAPSSYTPQKAWPLLVYLHGGVSAPRDGSGQSGLALFAEEADEKGFLIVSPSTQPEATWWDPAGVVYLAPGHRRHGAALPRRPRPHRRQRLLGRRQRLLPPPRARPDARSRASCR